MAVAGGIVAYYTYYRNSPLEAINVLNPRSANQPEISPVHSAELVPQTLTAGSVADETLFLQKGLAVSVFAQGLEKPRLLALSPDGIVFVSDMAAGTIIALPDDDADGHVDEHRTFASGLRKPHGMVFHGGFLYVAEENAIRRFSYTPGDRRAKDAGTVLVSGLPAGGNHVTRTIVVGADQKLYVSMARHAMRVRKGIRGVRRS